MTRIGDFFARVDNGSEYVPVASTVTSVIDFFVKIGLLFTKAETINQSHYYKHLKDKSFGRCLLLAVPVLGNVSVGLYDKFKKVDLTSFNEVLHLVKKHPHKLEMAQLFQDDPTIVKAAIQKDASALQYAHQDLLNNTELVNLAVSKDPTVLQFAHREQQFIIVSSSGAKLQYASEGFQNDPDFVNAAYNSNVLSLQFASKDQQLRKIQQSASPLHASPEHLLNNEFVDAAFALRPQILVELPEPQQLRLIALDGLNLQYASVSNKNKADFVNAAIGRTDEINEKSSNIQYASRDQQLRVVKQNGLYLEHISEDFKNEDEFVKGAIDDNPDALKFATYEQQLAKIGGDFLVALEHLSLELQNEDAFVNAYIGGLQINEKSSNIKYASRDQQLRVVKENGLYLEHISEDLKNEDDFVNAAFQQNKESLKFASNKQQKKLISNNPYGLDNSLFSLKFASKEVQEKFIKKRGDYLQFVADEYKNDREFVKKAIDKDYMALKFASNELQNDNEMIQYQNNKKGY